MSSTLFPSVLRDSVWHTTTSERYKNIIQTNGIIPEPALLDSERWGRGRGPEYYPFVRSVGGVSLFDFRGFDEVEYSYNYSSSMWRSFVPCAFRSNKAIWIEMDLIAIAGRFVDGKILRDKWIQSNNLYRNIVPTLRWLILALSP